MRRRQARPPGSSIGSAEQRAQRHRVTMHSCQWPRGVRDGYPARFSAGHCCTPRDWESGPKPLAATSRHAYGTRSSRHAIHGPFHPWAKPQDRRHVLMDAQRADEHCRPPPARGTCQRRATDTVGSSDLTSIDRLTIHPQGDTAGGRRCKPWYAARLLACRALAIDRCGASTTTVPARRSWNPRRLPSNRIRT